MSKRIKFLELIIALSIILIAVVLRFLPHPPNFVPIAAIALFSGAYFSRRTAFILPIAAMVISDIFIGYYNIGVMASVYFSFILTVVLGFWLKKRKKWPATWGAALLAAFIFFLITNFAVWLFTPWYAKTFSGLIQCYLLALPFFRNTLLGNLFYATSFFGAYELARSLIKLKIGKKYSVQIN